MKKAILPLLLMLIPYLAFSQANFCIPRVIHAPINLIGYSGAALTYRQLDITPIGIAPGIQLTNCSNIHIVKLKIHGNQNAVGIYMSNCKNINIDTVWFDGLAQGVYYVNCNSGSIHVNDNQFHDIWDVNVATNGRGHCIQRSHSVGPDLQINNNRIQNDASNIWQGDMISSYMSGGVATSISQIKGNWAINGGSGLGAKTQSTFITVGDGTGTFAGQYEDVENNIGVNTGYGGISMAGGQHMTIINNTIYSAKLPWSAFGIACANYTSGSGTATSTITNNTINWASGLFPPFRDTVYKAPFNSLPVGWKANIINRSINASILPANIIQVCSDLVFNPITNKVYGVVDFSPGATSSNPITYTSSNTSVCTIIGGLIHVLNVGTSNISATDGIDTLVQSVTITKATLNIIADNKVKAYGAPLPTLSATINGFQYSDNVSVFLTPLNITTSATQFSPPGIYFIVPSNATAENYNIIFFNGVMIIGINVGFTLPIGTPVINHPH